MKPCHARGIAATLLITASSFAQARLLVPGQFPEIGLAIQAAAPGSIIEVSWRAGFYQPFVVDRPITIVG
ncbi:MAG: hypothetical protein KA020_17230, partial [Planctomycetes bacterium]|nr:hypothetical protein [Planctomycetota bacterium]